MYLSHWEGGERNRERFHARTKRPATRMISRSRERQCPNNGLESELSDFWRRPASDLLKVFFLLPLASACQSSLFLIRVEKKKRSDVPVKVASWLLRSASTLPPSSAIFLNSPLPTSSLRAAQQLILSSLWVSSILALCTKFLSNR